MILILKQKHAEKDTQDVELIGQACDTEDSEPKTGACITQDREHINIKDADPASGIAMGLVASGHTSVRTKSKIPTKGPN